MAKNIINMVLGIFTILTILYKEFLLKIKFSIHFFQ